MKIGYVGSAFTSTGCRPDKSFRLSSYSEGRLLSTIDSNLSCIGSTLEFNKKNELLFYRIADFIPFASHPICEVDWLSYYTSRFKEIGTYIKKHEFRISMHPGQYTVLNSSKTDIVEKSIKELTYDVSVLDAMNLDSTAKVQIHVGGVYGDKNKAIKRFIKHFNNLPQNIQDRLVIENDDVSYDLQDCLVIHEKTGIPIVFDTFHHSIKNRGESIKQGIQLAQKTWAKKDGIMMLDWSVQEPEMKIGRHATSLDSKAFESFVSAINGMDFDIMLEVRDKEKSALRAVEILKNDGWNLSGT